MIEVVILAAIWLGSRIVATHDRALRIIERQSAPRQRKRKPARSRRPRT